MPAKKIVAVHLSREKTSGAGPDTEILIFGKYWPIHDKKWDETFLAGRPYFCL